MKTLLLKFAGPLQSWGTDSHFEVRHTDLYPSKSAVIGLIAACFGYRRDETQKIVQLNELDFAVRIDQQGEILRDFQTATKYKGNKVDHTYVTNRYYIQDAIYIVAIGSENEAWIDSIETAIRYPYFQPFLGRRSLPINVDFILNSNHEGVISSLSNLEFQGKIKKIEDSSIKLDVYADGHLIDGENSIMKQDRVISFSQKGRKFGFRSVKNMTMNIKIQKEEHDVFSSIGG